MLGFLRTTLSSRIELSSRLRKDMKPLIAHLTALEHCDYMEPMFDLSFVPETKAHNLPANAQTTAQW